MPVESWTKPEDVPDLAAQATARIDAVLTRLDAAGRETFWSSVTKCYNTPYNDPKPPPLVHLRGIADPECRPAADDEAAVALAALAAVPHPVVFVSDHRAP